MNEFPKFETGGWELNAKRSSASELVFERQFGDLGCNLLVTRTDSGSWGIRFLFIHQKQSWINGILQFIPARSSALAFENGRKLAESFLKDWAGRWF